MVYNPHNSRTYHSYLMANTRLVLDVDVQSGDRSHSSHSMPGLTPEGVNLIWTVS
jgi:hypothetical protein